MLTLTDTQLRKPGTSGACVFGIAISVDTYFQVVTVAETLLDSKSAYQTFDVRTVINAVESLCTVSDTDIEHTPTRDHGDCTRYMIKVKSAFCPLC